MRHLMLDAYGVKDDNDSDLLYVWHLLDDLCKEFKFVQVAPPQIFPYYYGKIKDDEGISAFVMLEGGHATIHTFPRRCCYFVDVFSSTDFDGNKVSKFFQKSLQYDETISNVYITDREKNLDPEDCYTPKRDFGPHLMAEIDSIAPFTLDFLYDFLENIVKEIDMERISRSTVFKQGDYISGIIVIAESHIALHYNKVKNTICADVFSCAPFDFQLLEHVFSRLGSVKRLELISRGTKHQARIRNR